MLRLPLIFLPFLLVTTTNAQTVLGPTTSVVSMLAMIPQCSVSCVMEDLFTSGGCPMTTAKDLAACACTNITMQATLSTCVQQSCGFLDQNQIVTFASGLCESYPTDSRVNELKTTSIVTIVLATLFLFLRLYSRWLKTRRLWSDDAYAIIAAVLLITVSVIVLEMSLKGFGHHYWDVPTTNAVELLKLFYVCQMLYVAVQIFSKVAILALYSRLFPDFIKWFRWSIRGTTAFMFIHGLVFFLLVVFQCLPIRSIWDKTITDAKCLPISAVIGFTGAGLSIMEDIIILLLPLPVVWKLQMSTKRKIGIIFLISVGSFASITSIVRLKYVVKYSNSFDSTWDNVDVLKWSLIEILAACICGNLLPLRPLLDQIMPPFRSIFTWHSNHKSSRKTSEKNSLGFRSYGRFGRASGPSKPKLISTLHFTQMSLSPTPAPVWGREKSTKQDQITVELPRAPASTQSNRKLNMFEEDYVQDLQHKSFGRTSDTAWRPQQALTESSIRPSRDGSETGMMPPPRERERRISGPWSRALAVLERR